MTLLRRLFNKQYVTVHTQYVQSIIKFEELKDLPLSILYMFCLLNLKRRTSSVRFGISWPYRNDVKTQMNKFQSFFVDNF